MIRNAIRAFSAVMVTLLFAASGLGQVATGTPPFGSFSNGGFDTVNMANLNVHLGIPILSKPGRGLPFHYVMDYESSIWAPTIVGSSTIWQPVNTKWGWTDATYWENGALKVLNAAPNALHGLPQQTYGVDGEGRPNSVTAASGQNPVTSAVYDLTNYKTTVNYGSLDSDVFTFDPNTGREKQYQFNVASQSVVGQENWNANGTLGSLVITDPLNASNSQTCNYSHDDLSRIASANCGSAWSQTFGPDPLGNLTKSGTGSFLPTYDPATNRFLSIPGGTPTYDNNGNLTYDLSHSYTWDAEGKALSIDTVNLIYDALGRMVEQARGAAYTQIVYAPAGSKLALMNGQTLQKAFVALPGGATAVYTASGLAYYRHTDWLGSSRLATTPTRTKYYDVAYGPYGESYAGSGTTDLSFTGENQDTVSGLYDFMYREYHPGQGRWISPDPSGLAAVDPASPQSWNRYTYVFNRPLMWIDLLGLDVTCPAVECIIVGGGGGGPRDGDGGGGSGGAGGDPSLIYRGGEHGTGNGCNAQCQVNRALLAALMAVLMNSQCANLIGGADPAAAVGAIAGQLFGNPDPFIQFNAGPDNSLQGIAYATTAPALVPVTMPGTTKSVLEPGSIIRLGPDFYNADTQSFPAFSLGQNQEGTILEEFGHALGFLSHPYGYGSNTLIMQDNTTNLAGVSYANSLMVLDHCITQPGDVPTQNSEVDGTIH